ncbi:hypothetical protein UWK_00630 [Desulfocapsa sulfexigens DSM 10523]|uniref:YhdP central domain-containing protein n=1 Tax=Desulfocapsa sulfexigens (strain DSM 10523 / SB164P1) TaxID=1167006 RepID=M1PL52_DESSD|nr:AsmA-like C-terminal domain-containing protein [Desulfocapsa sulfexigens]AGF77211.1 hypothetical protein UWK_00630 [Desulfocapsa sulfexigens DSM 10523]
MKRFFLTILVLCGVLLIAGGLFLKKGMHVKSLSAGPVTFSNVSLQWNAKLELDIERLFVASLQDGDGNGAPHDLSFMNAIVPLVRCIDLLFSRISIATISGGGMEGSLLYESSLAQFTLSSQEVDVRGIVRLEEGVLIADIPKIKSDKFHSQAAGVVRLDLDSAWGSGEFTVNLADSLPVNLSFIFDQEQLSFKGVEAGKITDITPFVDLFGLEFSIQKWITDYLSGTRYSLKSFAGSFPWKNPMVLAETFVAEVRVDECQYSFAPGLDAIQSEYADVLFKKGVLIITPHNSSFYGQDGEKSWLDINFNDPDNILLTAHILTHARANQDIVNVLNYYNIPLPVLQTEGETDVDLTLSINLKSELVTAHGVFQINDGRVDYSGANYGVKDARILLDTNRITFEQLEVSLEQMFVVDITGVYDASTANGDLDISLQECAVAVGKSQLVLNGEETKPKLRYTMSPGMATVTAEASSWNIGGLPLNIGSFSTSFSPDDLSGRVSALSLSVPPFISTEISGTFSLKEQRMDLLSTVVHCRINDLKLQDRLDGLIIQYDKGLTVRSVKESQWLLNDVPVTLSPAEFKFSDTLFSVTGAGVDYGEVFGGIVSGSFNYLSQHGEFLLEEFNIQEKSVGRFFNPNRAISVEVDGNEANLLLKVPELEVEVSVREGREWSLQLRNLAAVYDHSPILQQYLVKNGMLIIGSKDGGGYRFSADIPYDYALLAQDAVPVDRYQIEGEAGANGIRATVNETLNLVYDDKINIVSKGLTFNVPAILKLLKDIPGIMETDSGEQNRIAVTLDSSETGLFFSPERQLLADTITLQYGDGQGTLQLLHGATGRISLEGEGKTFSLTGEGLNDVFMNGLFPASEFHGGSMSMVAKGAWNDFTAIAKIKNTVLKEFKSLNNILSMINTIPALVTFSLPSYSTTGLAVDRIVAGIKMKEGVATFETLGLDSPEMTIRGTGWLDVPKQSLDMDLNLITGAKKNVNKIPLVGYILVGKKKKPSIMVELSGDLFDPKVEYSTFREVASVPFQILYRTLALPAHLVSTVFDVDDEVDFQENGWTPDEEELMIEGETNK